MSELHHPLGGVDNSLAYQWQPPYTTPRARNVRPWDVFELRSRIGSRPGLFKTHSLYLGGPIRWVDLVNAVKSDNFDFFSDTFQGYQADEYAGDSFGSNWGLQFLPALPTLETYRTNECVKCEGTTERGLVSDTSIWTDLSATAYRIGIFIVPYNGVHQGTYRIYARMNNTTPAATTDSVIGELTLSRGGVYSGYLRRYVSGVLTSHSFVNGTIVTDLPGWFELDISSSTTVKCFWQGVTLVSQTVDAAAGHRYGFSMQGENSAAICLVDSTRFQYFRTSKFEMSRPILLASAAGTLYYERYFGEMLALSSSCSLSSTEKLYAAELNNKIFIADWSNPLAAGTDGTNSDTSFDSATYADWTTLGLNVNDHSLQIVSGTGVSADSHAITNIAAGNLTLRPSPGATGSAITFRALRHPKVYDPVAQTLTPYVADYYNTGTVALADGVVTLTGGTFPAWVEEGRVIVISNQQFTVDVLNDDGTLNVTDTTTSIGSGASYFIGKGRVPLGCRIFRRWNGRIVAINDTVSPQQISMSAVNDAFDWDYSLELDTAAWSSGVATSDVGSVGEPTVDFITWRKDVAIIACRGSLHLLAGDPRRGGRIEPITSRLGLAAPGAWCVLPTGEVLMLTNEGIYITDTGCETCEPKPFSTRKLPTELVNIPRDSVVSFEYDNQYGGVKICLTHKHRRGGVTQWWFDLANKGFWPDLYGDGLAIMGARNYPAIDGDDACVVYGCSDGYLRRDHSAADTDDGTPIVSNVIIGPIKLGDLFSAGMLRTVRGVVDRASGNVGLRFYVGNSPQEALESTPMHYDATLQPGLSREVHPRGSGGSAFIEVSGQGIAWAVNELGFEVERMGRLKKR